MNKWPVFICYRQTDGMTAATRIYDLLHELTVPTADESGPQEASPILDVYFDQAAPGVDDWTAVHEPYLKRARAIVVVCTPGSKLNEGDKDWVHREINWWLANREMAPILVDPLGEDLRYVPDTIAKKWPNAQRIKLISGEWEGLSSDARQSLEDRVRAQFLGAIVPSSDSFYRQELERDNQREVRLRKIWRAAVGFGAALVMVIAAAAWIFTLKEAADEAAGRAQVASRQAESAAAEAVAAHKKAEAARRLAQIRVIEGQAARAQIEAQLLANLQEFQQYGPYRETMKEWETDFQTRADALRASVASSLPICDEVGAFTVYERQMVEVFLDNLPDDEAMFAYLAVVPASSAQDTQAPAVLDVFFGRQGQFPPRRDVSRATVKAMMASLPQGNQSGILTGSRAPLVLTHKDRTYRISRQSRMNDEGDMIMAFRVCLEAETIADQASSD